MLPGVRFQHFNKDKKEISDWSQNERFFDPSDKSGLTSQLSVLCSQLFPNLPLTPQDARALLVELVLLLPDALQLFFQTYSGNDYLDRNKKPRTATGVIH